jgi:aspartate 1-decarboxylase
MIRPFLHAKIHRMIVTQADLDYEGSLTLDRDLMDAADMLPFQKIEVYNVTRGTRLSTYLIEGPRGEGDCCINGAAAHLCKPGDRVIICTYAELSDEEIPEHKPRVVLVREHNKDWEIIEQETPFKKVG